MGAKLRILREELGLSQETVGRRLGLTKSGYGHYELGRAHIASTDIPPLAVALGVNNRELLTRLGLLPAELPAELRNAEIRDGELEHQLATICVVWRDADERGRTLSATLLDSAYRVLRQSRSIANKSHGPIRRYLVRRCPAVSA